MPTLVSDAKTSTQHDMCRVVLGDCRERLVDHEIYGLVDSPDRLCRFMESHIWAVWDFQSLLKAMQQHNVKEEGILYPMADQHLASYREELIERMDAVAIPA